MPLDTGIAQYRAGFQRFCISGVNPVVGSCKGLLWGQMHDPAAPPTVTSYADITTAATPDVPVQVISPSHAEELFGKDSQLAIAAYLYFAQVGGYLGNGALWAVPALDNAAGTAATYDINIGGTPTVAGSFDFRIFDHITGATSGYYSIATLSTDTAITIATAIAADINGDENSLFIADNAAGTTAVVTLTHKHKGTIGNNVVLQFNTLYGQAFPDGITATFGVSAVTVAVGAGDPDFSTAIGNLSNCGYDCWGFLNEDPVSIELVNAEVESRWACATEQTFGHLFTSRTEADAATLIAYANTFNDETRSIIPNLTTYKYSGWLFTAAWTGRVCARACESPGRPVVRTNGILEILEDNDPCDGAIFSFYEQEQMVSAGLSMWGYNTSGNIFITNNITNWKYNASGDRDITWTNCESRYLVPALVNVIKIFNNTYYSSSALVDDGVQIPEGENTTSPTLYKGHLIAHLAGQTDDTRISGVIGRLINSADLNNDIQVANNTDGQAAGYGDCHRLDVLIDAKIIKQLLRIATGIRINPC